MPSGTGLKHLEQEIPERYIDVGIAEEHAVIFAVVWPRWVCTPWLPFTVRSCSELLTVLFTTLSAGSACPFSAWIDPVFHRRMAQPIMVFLISSLRCIPNIIAMAPKDEDGLVDMMFTATHIKHPLSIRYPRGAAEGVEIKEPKLLEVGKAEVIQHFNNKEGSPDRYFGFGQPQLHGHGKCPATRGPWL